MKNVKLQFKNQNAKEKAYEYAMFLLNICLRTEGELREKLKGKRYQAEIIDEVIKDLKDQHYVNDQNYAEVYLENLKKYKTWGYFGIKKKLIEKRLPANIIESVLLVGLSEEEEVVMAKRLIKKYEFRNMNFVDKKKLAKKLASKGFRSSVISELVF